MPHIYIFAEDMGLTAPQRATIIAQLQALGTENDGPRPHLRNHSRVRLDGNAIILESSWLDSDITAAAIKTRLVNLFGVAANTVTFTTSTVQLGPATVPPSELALFKYNAANKLRLGVFAGRAASWGESWQAVTQYLAANRAAWESAV